MEDWLLDARSVLTEGTIRTMPPTARLGRGVGEWDATYTRPT